MADERARTFALAEGYAKDAVKALASAESPADAQRVIDLLRLAEGLVMMWQGEYATRRSPSLGGRMVRLRIPVLGVRIEKRRLGRIVAEAVTYGIGWEGIAIDDGRLGDDVLIELKHDGGSDRVIREVRVFAVVPRRGLVPIEDGA